MACIIEEKRNGKKYYYLDEALRDNGKVKHKRTYLGTNMPIRRWRGWTNLSQETIDYLKRQASLKTKSTIIAKPNGKYRTIVIDPPWPIKTIDLQARAKEGTQPYPTMTITEIKNNRKRVPVRKLIDKTGCHVFLWTTQKHLRSAFDILGAWGLKHIFTMVWHKHSGMQPFNMPRYNCEFVLYGRIGKVNFLDTKNFPTCFYSQSREHSRKPDEFYDVVKRVCASPRIDMFSREIRDGFDQYGNDLQRFTENDGN